ncbi:MAG: glycosyltransferase family 9 protein [Acidobacteriota bacterium]
MRRILVTHTGGGLGDVLLCTPIAAALRRRFPGGDITWWVSPAHAPLLQGSPCVHRVWTASPEGRWRDLYSQVRAASYDAVVMPWTNTRQAWLMALADVPRRVGPGGRMQYEFLFTDRVHDGAALGDTRTHFVEMQLEFARALGCDISGLAPHVTVSPVEHADAAALLERHGVQAGEAYLVLHVGRGMDIRSRIWPTERFAEIGRHLRRDLACRIVLTGTAGEREMVARVAADIGDGAVNLAGRTSLRQVCAVIARARLCVSLDTGPAHLAAALGVPVVALFPMACYPPDRWHPYGVTYRVVRTGAWQCPRHCAKETCPDFQCHNAIDVRAAVLAARELWERRGLHG